MIKMHGNKDTKIGHSQQAPDGRLYYYDGLNYVLPLCFSYRNHKGSISERTVIPVNIYYGVTEFYKQPCHILHGFDIDKKDYRDFKLVNITRFF